MPVQQEIKSQLAKLLATEDLVVEHRKVATAQFDVHKRVLTLPMWESASNMFDLLVGHESDMLSLLLTKIPKVSLLIHQHC